jgi:hypothetical protein
LNRRPLRPELAAPLGVCPLPQLMEGVGGSSCSLLSVDVAVLCCCTGALPVSFVGAARCAVPTRRPSVFQAGRTACSGDRDRVWLDAVVRRWWGLAADVAVNSAQVVRWQADLDRRATRPEGPEAARQSYALRGGFDLSIIVHVVTSAASVSCWLGLDSTVSAVSSDSTARDPNRISSSSRSCPDRFKLD